MAELMLLRGNRTSTTDGTTVTDHQLLSIEAGRTSSRRTWGKRARSGASGGVRARFAPEGHPLAERQKPLVQDVKPVDGKVEEPNRSPPAVEAVPSNDPATAPTHPA